MTSAPPAERLDAIVARHASINATLASAPEAATFVALSRELADLDPVVAAIGGYRAAAENLSGLDGLIADPSTDPEMRALAEEERSAAAAAIEQAAQNLKLLLLPKDEADEKSAILEVRAGTGGDEAALFAGNLFRMYARYAEFKGWKVEILSQSEGAAGAHGVGLHLGLVDLDVEILGLGQHRNSCGGGVDAAGGFGVGHALDAVHAALELEPREDAAALDLGDDLLEAAGGQHVNKTESAVRLTHIPSGIVVVVQEERSQHKNKAKAYAVLRARLYDAERSRKDQARAADRRSQVGSGDRSERIRTYNFQQGRVTDHRINLTLYRLEEVMAGTALDEIIDALTTEHQAAQLAAQGA